MNAPCADGTTTCCWFFGQCCTISMCCTQVWYIQYPPDLSDVFVVWSIYFTFSSCFEGKCWEEIWANTSVSKATCTAVASSPAAWGRRIALPSVFAVRPCAATVWPSAPLDCTWWTSMISLQTPATTASFASTTASSAWPVFVVYWPWSTTPSDSPLRLWTLSQTWCITSSLVVWQLRYLHFAIPLL